MRILLIEDDKVIASFIKHAISQYGHVIDHKNDGKEGFQLAQINKSNYDLIILDVLLPSMDGLKICRLLREEGDTTPILMLSGRDSTENKVEGLDSGADDYLTKPFEMDELYARIKALHRRATGEKNEMIEVQNIVLDPNAYEVKVDGNPVELTNLEFRLLMLLMHNKDKVVTRSDIIEKVWDMYGGELFSNSTNVHMKNLRKKIESGSVENLIKTIRGVGYKFIGG
ncbi:MAG: response regulator transcription factor [Candidatus Dojkabacteria bacterium]|nr:response regulator transcription factor [Candidatus Dojkabacteria bacterium]MDQ7020370.1 response regulator transcription factor [Candidatus Dojkabacteria bacterium]